MKLYVTDISYSQNFIADYFDNGKSLVNLCRDYLSGKVRLDSLKLIKVVYQDGHYVVKDGNRRLFVLKMLHTKLKLKDGEIPVKIISTNRKLELVPDDMLLYCKILKKDIKKCIRGHNCDVHDGFIFDRNNSDVDFIFDRDFDEHVRFVPKNPSITII